MLPLLVLVAVPSLEMTAAAAPHVPVRAREGRAGTNADIGAVDTLLRLLLLPNSSISVTRACIFAFATAEEFGSSCRCGRGCAHSVERCEGKEILDRNSNLIPYRNGCKSRMNTLDAEVKLVDA